jgi:hypothetical protein
MNGDKLMTNEMSKLCAELESFAEATNKSVNAFKNRLANMEKANFLKESASKAAAVPKKEEGFWTVVPNTIDPSKLVLDKSAKAEPVKTEPDKMVKTMPVKPVLDEIIFFEEGVLVDYKTYSEIVNAISSMVGSGLEEYASLYDKLTVMDEDETECTCGCEKDTVGKKSDYCACGNDCGCKTQEEDVNEHLSDDNFWNRMGLGELYKEIPKSDSKEKISNENMADMMNMAIKMALNNKDLQKHLFF